MSATIHEIVVRAPSAPPDAPRREDYHAIDLADVDLLVGESEPTVAGKVVEGTTTRLPERPTDGPCVIERDEEGIFIVADILGAVYGAGPTLAEAKAEFDAALVDHLRFLRENLGALDARLREQLAVLERLFPGR